MLFAHKTRSTSIIDMGSKLLYERYLFEIQIFTFISYSATTRTGALEKRFPNHDVSGKQKILRFFGKPTNKIQDSTMQTLKTLKPPGLPGNSPKIYECYWSVCKTTRKSFAFKKRCNWIIFFPSSRTVNVYKRGK